jgi:hypothetical protein
VPKHYATKTYWTLEVQLHVFLTTALEESDHLQAADVLSSRTVICFASFALCYVLITCFTFFSYSSYICFLVLYVLLFRAPCFCIVLRIVSPHLHSCLRSTCVPIDRSLPPGGNPIAVNTFHVISYIPYHISVNKFHIIYHITSHHIIYHITSHHIISYQRTTTSSNVWQTNSKRVKSIWWFCSVGEPRLK